MTLFFILTDDPPSPPPPLLLFCCLQHGVCRPVTACIRFTALHGAMALGWAVLQEVQDTYHDVRRLEASIIELHKMFMDLALLVDRQGEMLDQIEYQVTKNAARSRPYEKTPK